MSDTTSEKHFDKIASSYDSGKKKYSYYYESLKKLLGELIPQNKNVFEIGCGTGDLLNHLRPKHGYGHDISREMISISNSKFLISKNLTFSTRWPERKFDYIFMSDVIEHLDSPKEVFQKIPALMGEKSKFIITMANPIWEPLLLIWEKLGLKMREGPHIRLSTNNLKLIINNSKLKIIKHDYTLLIPINIPIITNFANRYLEKYFKRLAFVEYFVAVKA